MDLSERLKTLRKQKNLSQEQVSEVLGVSRQAISKWESGQGKPEIDNIIKLTQLYNVTCDYILTGQEIKLRSDTPEKKDLRSSMRVALAIVTVIVSTAIITLLFIATLNYIG